MLRIVDAIESLILRFVPFSLAALVARIGLAVPFWKSGLTKWSGFGQLSDSALTLFQEEFKFHVLGRVYDYPFPTLMAYMSGIGEIVLPILLVLGLFTRVAAFGVLVMILVIQLTVPDGWPIHITWAAMALAIIVLGPGKVSADSRLRRG